jgi:hypothetical protein
VRSVPICKYTDPTRPVDSLACRTPQSGQIITWSDALARNGKHAIKSCVHLNEHFYIYTCVWYECPQHGNTLRRCCSALLSSTSGKNYIYINICIYMYIHIIPLYYTHALRRCCSALRSSTSGKNYIYINICIYMYIHIIPLYYTHTLRRCCSALRSSTSGKNYIYIYTLYMYIYIYIYFIHV